MRLITNIMIAACLAIIGIVLGPHLADLLNHPSDAAGLCTSRASLSDLAEELRSLSRLPEVTGPRSPWLDANGAGEHAFAAQQWQDQLDRARTINASRTAGPSGPSLAPAARASDTKPTFKRRPLSEQPRSIFERSNRYRQHGSVYPLKKHRRHGGRIVRRTTDR